MFTGVYAYEDGALETLKEAKNQGIFGFYDLPIGYWRTARRLMHDAANDHPEWASTITGLNDSDEKLSRKDGELGLAHEVFVASSFTANTLGEFPGELPRVSILP